MDLATQLRDRRQQARAAADAILTRAAEASRDLTAEEHQEHARQVAAEREASDALDQLRDDQLAELRARPAQFGPPVLTRADEQLADQFRSAILEKNPAPIEVRAEKQRLFQPAMEYRDLLKTTATQALPVSVFDRIMMHLVENSAVMGAGAFVVNTDTGEDLQVPKSTAFVSSALTAEGALITESDPTLGVQTLKAYGYKSFFQIGRELATDTPTDLLNFLARQAAVSLGLAFGPHLITGTGTNQPTGIVTTATVGKTGPVGTTVSLGTQATAGQGTDILFDLIGSLAEPYSQQPATAFIMTNASRAICQKLKDSTGQPVPGVVGPTMLGYPRFVDPSVAQMAANAKSIIFGDLSRYVVRIAGGVRFERSDEFAFQNDLVSFRCVTRLDGALVDANAIKLFQNSAT